VQLPTDAEIRQTHISTVFLTSDRAYKTKRPVSLGFVDYSTRELRRAACEAEVALNRRLAPDVYLGVVELPDGEPAVEMVRLRDEDTLLERLHRGEVDVDLIRRVGATLGAFHAAAPDSAEIRAHGSPARFAHHVRENFDQTRDHVPTLCHPTLFARLEAASVGGLGALLPRLEARLAAGRVRDGHGDLRLEHVYVDDRGAIRVIDGVEFNPAYRCGDVALDLAFLVMDLRVRSRWDLADALVGAWSAVTGDDPTDLLPSLVAYRSVVRAKVAGFMLQEARSDFGLPPGTPGIAGGARSEPTAPAEDGRQHRRKSGGQGRHEARSDFGLPPGTPGIAGGARSEPTAPAEDGRQHRRKSGGQGRHGAPLDRREALAARARRHWSLAWGELAPARPVLLAVGGRPGTGKSTVARALAGEGVEVVRSDVVRKELAGVADTTKLGRAAYGAAAKDRVYEACVARAEEALARGDSAVIDATFTRDSWRRLLLPVARRWAVPVGFARCRAPREVVAARLAARRGDASDADLSVYDATVWESASPEVAERSVALDTSRSAAEVAAAGVAWRESVRANPTGPRPSPSPSS
jgi:aminoglycoside phosphotransferase family enzyme/predicted kinase